MSLLLILKRGVDTKLEFCNSYESPFEKCRLNFVLGSFFFFLNSHRFENIKNNYKESRKKRVKLSYIRLFGMSYVTERKKKLPNF